MQLHRDINYSGKLVKTVEPLNYDKSSRNNFLKEQLSSLLSHTENPLNKNLEVNKNLSQIRIHKRSSECKSTNGNLGRMPIYLHRMIS